MLCQSVTQEPIVFPGCVQSRVETRYICLNSLESEGLYLHVLKRLAKIMASANCLKEPWNSQNTFRLYGVWDKVQISFEHGYATESQDELFPVCIDICLRNFPFFKWAYVCVCERFVTKICLIRKTFFAYKYKTESVLMWVWIKYIRQLKN